MLKLETDPEWTVLKCALRCDFQPDMHLPRNIITVFLNSNSNSSDWSTGLFALNYA